jgi:hypothetical protein
MPSREVYWKMISRRWLALAVDTNIVMAFVRRISSLCLIARWPVLWFWSWGLRAADLPQRLDLLISHSMNLAMFCGGVCMRHAVLLGSGISLLAMV